MPSTYTNNTGIEKPGDGEQAGLWGITANTSYDIIDRAVNGVATVSLSGTTYTLTTSNGTLSEGQYAGILFTGTLGATCTVTISPNTAQKTYLMRNGTNQSVVITQGSGGNVTLGSGDSAVIVCTGGGSGASVISVVRGPVAGSSSNTPNTLVQRDGSGNFSAGTITASLSGNASTATSATSATSAATWTTSRTLTIGSTGKSVNGSANVSWSLAEIGAQAASADLTALAGASTGILTNTGVGTAAARTMTASTGMTITNGDGVSGNPTFAVNTATTAEIRGLSGTNKLPTTAGISTAAALTTPSGAADWTPDWSSFISATWVLTGARTLNNPTNVIAGTTRVVRVASSSSTSQTISYGTNYKGFSLPASVTNTAVVLLTLYAVSSTEIVVSAVEYTT